MFRNKALTGFISRLPSFNKNKITLRWSPCDAIYEWNIRSLSFVLKANNIWKYFLFVWIKTRAEMYRPSSVWRIRIFQVISLIYYIRNWPWCSWIPYKSLLLQRSEITQMVNVHLFRFSRSTFPQLWSSELSGVYWVTIYIWYMEHTTTVQFGLLVKKNILYFPCLCPRNVGLRPCHAADRPRRLYCIQSPWTLQILMKCNVS
jgi:hypothetical protein